MADVDVTITSGHIVLVEMAKGTSGFSGRSGYSGFSGANPGASGFTGFSGYSGFSGVGTSGFSGAAFVGSSGFSGRSGYSGFSGPSGYSGFSGANPGASGYSGYSGTSGYSGYSGISGSSGYSGFSGNSGYSGYSGIGTITAAHGSDDTYTGITLIGLNAGATIAQWEAVYLGGSSTWLLADGDGSSTYPAQGLAVAAYSSTNPAIILIFGSVRNDAFNFTPGGALYLSTTPGAITQTPPSASGSKIQRIGYALTADIVFVDFNSTYLTNT